MKMIYDEIRITTRREIDVCQGAIRKLEREIETLEEKCGPVGAADGGAAKADLGRWQECCLALERWQQRLLAHQQIMKL